jgi:fucose 4-O-acetylase-like acetyltransferase
VGITLVVYGHVARGLQTAGIGPGGAATDIPVSMVYTFHMPLFFFLSGLFFLPSLERHGVGGLLRGKLDTILWPFLLWSLVQGAVEVQLSAYKNDPTTWAQVFSLLWQPRAQFWFLYALFTIFVLAALYFRAFPRGLVFALLIGLASYLWPVLLPGVTPLLLASQGLVFFVTGIVFARHADIERLARPGIALTLLGGAILCQILFHFEFGLRNSDRGFALLLLALVSIAATVALSALCARRPNRLVSLIGTSTMAIFVLHILTGSGARVLLQRVLGVESFAVHLGVGMVAGLFLPIAIAAVAKRLGVRYLFEAPLSRLVPGSPRKP